MHHLNITFPDDLKKKLDSQVKHEKTKRSTLIQKAVKVYLQFQHKRSLNRLLAEGYQEMAGEAKMLTKEFESLDVESLRHLD